MRNKIKKKREPISDKFQGFLGQGKTEKIMEKLRGINKNQIRRLKVD